MLGRCTQSMGDYFECKEKAPLSKMTLYNIIPNSTYTYIPPHSFLYSLSSSQCQHVDPNNLGPRFINLRRMEGWVNLERHQDPTPDYGQSLPAIQHSTTVPTRLLHHIKDKKALSSKRILNQGGIHSRWILHPLTGFCEGR